MRFQKSFPVDPEAQRVVKFFPSIPPRRGEIILIDGLRCRVTRSKVSWREPGVWRILRLRARLEP